MEILNTCSFVAAIIAVADANEYGFTINASSLEDVKHGYSVAIKETQNSFGPEGIENVHDAIIAGLADHVGGWLDSETGLYYFDAVRIFTNLDEAMNFARENGQIAIFNLDTLEEIRL